MSHQGTGYTPEEREKIIQMWRDGSTLEEIGKAYGISRQAVSLNLHNWMGNGRIRENKRYSQYPGLQKWMVENGIRPTKLARMMGFKHASSIYNLLLGSGGARKETIDKILAVTGLTYEELFGKLEYKGKPKIELGDDFFGAVLNCAIRYCIGRRTYMPSLVMDFIRPLLPYLSKKTLWCMVNDIERVDDYGMAMDEEMWKGFLKAVKEVQNDRQENG